MAEVDPETGFVRQKLMKQKLPSDATTGGRPFLVRDFIICEELNVSGPSSSIKVTGTKREHTLRCSISTAPTQRFTRWFGSSDRLTNARCNCH